MGEGGGVCRWERGEVYYAVTLETGKENNIVCIFSHFHTWESHSATLRTVIANPREASDHVKPSLRWAKAARGGSWAYAPGPFGKASGHSGKSRLKSSRPRVVH